MPLSDDARRARCSRRAGGRSPRSAGRASPSACGRYRPWPRAVRARPPRRARRGCRRRAPRRGRRPREARCPPSRSRGTRADAVRRGGLACRAPPGVAYDAAHACSLPWVRAQAGRLRTAPSSRFVPPSPAGFVDSITTVPGREASAELFDEPPPRHPRAAPFGGFRAGQALRLLFGCPRRRSVCRGVFYRTGLPGKSDFRRAGQVLELPTQW